MTLADFIATIGVSILLVAFIFNSRNLMAADKKWYNMFNIAGATLFGYSAYLIHFYPFVILEGLWTLFATVSLFKSVSRETPADYQI